MSESGVRMGSQVVSCAVGCLSPAFVIRSAVRGAISRSRQHCTTLSHQEWFPGLILVHGATSVTSGCVPQWYSLILRWATTSLGMSEAHSCQVCITTDALLYTVLMI